MALFLIFRPLVGIFEPTKRPDPASIRKMLAEGGLNETITFLGWQINTRSLTVALPQISGLPGLQTSGALKRDKQLPMRTFQNSLGN